MRLYKSIIGVHWLGSLAVIAVMAICLAGAWAYSEMTEMNREVARIKSEMEEAHREVAKGQVDQVVKYIEYRAGMARQDVRAMLRDRVRDAFSLVDHIYESSKSGLNGQALQDILLGYLRSLRYNSGRGYYFVVTGDGRMLLTASTPEMEGKEILGNVEKSREALVRDMLEFAGSHEEGYYDYTWPKPGMGDEDYPKIAYFKHFAPFDWYIGTGAYMDDLLWSVQREILDMVGKIRFEPNGYVFVFRSDGLFLIHPNQDFIGTYRMEEANATGTSFASKMQEIVYSEDGRGFVRYIWKKPDTGEETEKVTYLRYYKDWDWVVCAGVYLEDIQDHLAGELAMRKKRSLRKGALVAAIFLCGVLAAGLFIWFVTSHLRRGFATFHTFFSQAAETETLLDENTLPHTEFKGLAQVANSMIAALRKGRESMDKAQKLAHIGSFARDFRTKEIFWSPELRRMFGLAPDVPAPTLEKFLELLHPQDRSLYLQAAEETLSAGHTEVLVRYLSPDQNLRYARCVMEVDRDEQGNAIVRHGFIQDVTSQEAAEAALRETREEFRAIADHTYDWESWLDTDGALKWINPAVRDLTGYTMEECLAMEDYPLPMVFPEDRAVMQRLFSGMARTRSSGNDFPFRIRHKDGRVRWMAVSWVPIYKKDGRYLGIRTSARDFTLRKEAEEEAHKLRQYLASIVDSMPSVLVGVDESLRVSHWSLGAADFTSIEEQQAMGRDLFELLPPLAEFRERFQNAMKNKQAMRESNLAWKEEGDANFFDLTFYPLMGKGQQGGVIRMDEVTHRVRMEEVMIQSEKMLSIGGMAAGMAHEINNPLAAIMGNIQVIRQRLSAELPKNLKVAEDVGLNIGALPAYIKERGLDKMLASAMDAGSRAAAIVSDMLSFSRWSEARIEPQDLAAILDQTYELASSDYDLKKHYDFKNIRAVRNYEELPLVPCDRNKLRQVFLNILGNGAHAMAQKQYPPGESPQFTLSISREDSMARVDIRDNGPGIPPHILKRIFEPFFTTKEVGLGTGLGLSVSYFIITENHNGSLTSASTPPDGTTFTIRLPFASKG